MAVAAQEQAYSELFDAAETVREWILTLPVHLRPLAKYYRLQEALNAVREAHQLAPSPDADQGPGGEG